MGRIERSTPSENWSRAPDATKARRLVGPLAAPPVAEQLYGCARSHDGCDQAPWPAILGDPEEDRMCPGCGEPGDPLDMGLVRKIRRSTTGGTTNG